ncbi:MAG: hypothetical protein HC924_15825 [Synechococcaceae cyanobacterium SM2_3_2]|nr:hypothetical protein [Synechococcaceae cyanobacterium SM2_3_2]
MSDQQNGSPETYYVDDDGNVVMAVFTLDDSDPNSGERLFHFMTQLLGDN